MCVYVQHGLLSCFPNRVYVIQRGCAARVKEGEEVKKLPLGLWIAPCRVCDRTEWEQHGLASQFAPHQGGGGRSGRRAARTTGPRQEGDIQAHKVHLRKQCLLDTLLVVYAFFSCSAVADQSRVGVSASQARQVLRTDGVETPCLLHHRHTHTSNDKLNKFLLSKNIFTTVRFF